VDKKEHHSKATQPVHFTTQDKRVTEKSGRVIRDDETNRQGAEQV
jgi:hypothetical protein